MPSGIAAAVRESLAVENVADDELVSTPWGKTGYVGVIDIDGKFQAQARIQEFQVPGESHAPNR